MNQVTKPSEVRMIPVNRIEVLNPRDRNARVFDDIVSNIKEIGLKKPVTVTPRPGPDGVERYLLICGEGRLKAFQSLGEAAIPALVVMVNDDDAFIMSLAENIARRHYRPLELLAGIEALRKQGYDQKVIAAKTGLSPDYVLGMLTLLEHGEERLLVAVEKERIPLTVAVAIVYADKDNKAVQAALQGAYESGQLRGRQLLEAKRILARRQRQGRALGVDTLRNPGMTASNLVRAYQQEVERQRLLVRKAEFAQQRLLFVVGALRQLLADEHFATLLRAEGLDTLPRYVAEQVTHGGG